MIDLDVKRLRTLIAIVREKSFTAAAERLNMSQPWVSEQIKQLEDSIELPLIERVKGKFVRLTSHGQDFLPIAERLVSAWDDARHDVELLRRRERARLIVGVDPVTLYMPERNRLIADLMAELPDLDLQIVNETPEELFEGLESGRLHVILTLCPPPSDELEILPLYQFDLKLFVPHELAGKVDTRDLTAPGSRILVLRDSYHPAFFAWLRAQMAESRLQWVSCAETSFHALVQHAVMLGIPTLSPDFSDQMPELSLQMKAFDIPRPVAATWALMRKPGQQRKAAQRLWSLAARSRLAATSPSRATARA
ncbi:MAG TPA: LysR family transcriptional regulator [Sphingobium sp.]|nr:LysR family transcriptional regulator [Sphingobium sp.]